MSYQRRLYVGPFAAALLTGHKFVHRIPVAQQRTAGFQPRELVEAYDHEPRRGGTRLATVRITERPYVENTSEMPDEHYETGGYAYLDKVGTQVFGVDAAQAWVAIRKAAVDTWVIHFEVVDVHVPLDGIPVRAPEPGHAPAKA